MVTQQAQYEDRVAFFHGCFANYDHPQLGRDLIKVPNVMSTGIRLLSKEKCCGISLIANGFTDKAHKQAVTSVGPIREAARVKSVPVITTSSTYTFALRDEYPEVLNVDSKGLRDHIELATRWLWYKLGESKTLPLKPLPLKVVYHTPCHMERMGWTLYTLELLRRVPGLELMVLSSQCCGIAGTYGFKKENYPTSQATGAPLFRQIEENGTDLAVTDYGACKW